MNKKIYTCKQCGDQLEGQRRKFCNTDCNQLWSRDQLKMDYGDGRCHNPMSRFGEDGSIEAVHVPYNVLQEAKNIFDLLNSQKKPNRLIIFATHNRFFANKADYLLELTDGSIKSTNV